MKTQRNFILEERRRTFSKNLSKHKNQIPDDIISNQQNASGEFWG